MDAAAYYYGQADDKSARRVGARAAPRAVPPYKRLVLSFWPKPDRAWRDLTLLLAEGDRMAVRQARKEVGVPACEGYDVSNRMTSGRRAKGLNGAGWLHDLEALSEFELAWELHVAYPIVLSYYYYRMMGDDRSCFWEMYVVERVQLTAIMLLADFTGWRVHLISLAFLHRLERVRLDDMAEGSAKEHDRLQRLLQGTAVVLPKWEDVVEAAGLPLGQTPLPAEVEDSANPHGFRVALDAGGVLPQVRPRPRRRGAPRHEHGRWRRGTRGRGTPGAEALRRLPRSGRRHARNRRRGGPRRRRGRRRGGAAGPKPGGRRLGCCRRRCRQRERGRPVGGRHVGQGRRVGRGRRRASRCHHRHGGYQRPRPDGHEHRRRGAGRHAIVAEQRRVGQRRYRLSRN